MAVVAALFAVNIVMPAFCVVQARVKLHYKLRQQPGVQPH